MGNSASALESYRYHFDNPKIGDLDLTYVKVYEINDEASAEAAEKFLRDKRILYVDCEGDSFGNPTQKLGTVQIATSRDRCLVFHITKYRKSLDFLKKLFESDDVQKVFHDCSGDSSVLYMENRIQLTSRSVDDTQIAHKCIESARYRKPIDLRAGRSLADLYRIYCGKSIPGNKRVKRDPSAMPGMNKWMGSHLSSRMIKYAVVDALVILEIFTVQQRMLRKTSQYKELIKEQLQVKRKNFDDRRGTAQVETPGSSNWGLYSVGVGAAAVFALGAIAAMAGKDEKDKRKEDEDQQKKDECIIS